MSYVPTAAVKTIIGKPTRNVTNAKSAGQTELEIEHSNLPDIFRTISTSFVGSSTEDTLVRPCSTGLSLLPPRIKMTLGITLVNN